MKKTRIVYSLTERGLFSELSNLALAMVYAQRHGMALQVNTRRWCARVDKGWTDYFEQTVEDNDCFMASQFRIFESKGLWIGTIYYHTCEYFKYYIPKVLNSIYLLFHPRTMLSTAVVPQMRQHSFLYNASDDIYTSYSETLRSILQYNNVTKEYIEKKTSRIGLPDNYIAIHIRRGDKIALGEMQSIPLDRYEQEVLAHRAYSDNVYIASDDISVVDYLKPKLESAGFCVYHNLDMDFMGYDQCIFNSGTKEARRQTVLDTLLDMHILINSIYFIGTFSSNIGRIVPLYIGNDKCCSLDDKWSYGEDY